MPNNYNILEVLEFYYQNNLDEIYSNEAIESIISREQVNINTHSIENSESNSVQIKFMNSTAQAINQLAIRQQKSTENPQNNPLTMNNEQGKFLTLNQIVDSAKKLAQSANTVFELKKAVESFDGCNLKKMATNTVFSDGNPNSKIVVIGEAPGNNEDLTGIPFCGDSGELLNAMFSSIDLSREKDLYITNVIFWRPPGNRRPTDEEVAICRPFLERHLELLNPKLIILVGSTAMNSLIKSTETISQIRGKFIEAKLDFVSKDCKILTIFHPSFLMRQPAKKKLAWQDMLSLKEFIKKNYE